MPKEKKAKVKKEKKAKGKKGPKKNEFGHKDPDKVKLISLHMPLKKGGQMFPDRYLVTAHNQVISDIQLPGLAGIQSFFQYAITANSFAASNFATLSGTGTSFTGTFASTQNVPAGLYYLLGDQNAGLLGSGAQAPYLNYRIHSCMIKATYIPSLAAIANTSANTQLTIFPTNTAPYNSLSKTATAFTGFSNTQLAEQPYAETADYPTNMTTNPKALVNKMSTLRIEGDSYKATLENPSFSGQFSTSPQSAWWWMVTLTTIRANSADFAINGSLILDLYYDIEFFNRGNYETLVPV